MIERVEVFTTMGKQFDTVEKAVGYREDLIEEFLRKAPGFQTMAAKSRIDFVQSIIDHRKDLIALLDYELPAFSNDN